MRHGVKEHGEPDDQRPLNGKGGAAATFSFFGSFLFRIGPTLVGQTDEIVDTGLIEDRELSQHTGRDHALTAFIIGIGSLRDIDRFAHGLLRQVVVLAQIPDSRIFLQIHHQGKV